jgi:hypothetical protein
MTIVVMAKTTCRPYICLTIIIPFGCPLCVVDLFAHFFSSYLNIRATNILVVQVGEVKIYVVAAAAAVEALRKKGKTG